MFSTSTAKTHSSSNEMTTNSGLYPARTEANAVNNFINNSAEFKKMCNIHLSIDKNKPEYKQINDLINNIKTALSFNQLFICLEYMDFDNSNDPTVKKLGKTGMNALLFFAGYFSDEASIGYYGHHLRENAVIEMTKLGFRSEALERKAASIK